MNHQTPPSVSSRRSRKGKSPGIFLNVVIALLLLVVGYLSYSFIGRIVIAPPVDPSKSGGSDSAEVIQLDVLNGCGASGAASKVTAHLRSRGFDVVEMRNYKSFDVSETLVIDRTGNLETAKKVAYALGIKEKNVIQQLNADYYLDVSVVIGKDHNSLKPFQ